MRISLAIAAGLLSAGAVAAADDAPWCYRDFSGPEFSNCRFYSARRCLAVAGTMGGVCERNHRPLPAAKSKPKAKHARS